jgi:hypothetical protein
MIDRQRDVRVKAEVALQHSPTTELRQLRVDREGDRLRICGRVGCFYHKQLATETVRSVAGGMRLENCVAVDS